MFYSILLDTFFHFFSDHEILNDYEKPQVYYSWNIFSKSFQIIV